MPSKEEENQQQESPNEDEEREENFNESDSDSDSDSDSGERRRRQRQQDDDEEYDEILKNYVPVRYGEAPPPEMNTPEINVARFNRAMKSPRYQDLLDYEDDLEEDVDEAEVYNESLFDFPKDPENWMEQDLRELWADAPLEMTKPGWDPAFADEEDWEVVKDMYKAGKVPPIAPFYLPYRQPYPVVPDDDVDIATPKAVIEELDRIEEFLTWVSYVFADGSSYEGTVWDDLAHGKGVYIAEQGLVRYEGEWLQNNMEGHGVVEVDIPDIEPVPGSKLEEEMRAEGKIFSRDFMSPEDKKWLEMDIEDSIQLAGDEYEIPFYERDEWITEFGKKPEKGRYRYAGQWKHGRMHGCGLYEINERPIYGRFYFGELLEDSEGCDEETVALHAGLAEVAAAKARMFVNKPDGMVREESGPYSDPQHPYFYEEEDVWMAPGFINQFYEVPDYWKTYVHEIDQEREIWLNSFYKSPLRIPMPAELEHWWEKEEPPEYIFVNKEPEPDPEDPSKLIYTEDPLILHTPTGRLINYIEDEEHGVRLFWQPPLKEGQEPDPEKIEFLPLGFDEFYGRVVEDKETTWTRIAKGVENKLKPMMDKLGKWTEEKKKESEMKLQLYEKELELIEAELCLEEAIEEMDEELKKREEEEEKKAELGLEEEENLSALSSQPEKATAEVGRDEVKVEEGEGEEEEEEEEEEEPRLKYQRMGGSLPSLLANDAASCVAVAERMIALGTHAGTVHILDFLGNQVKEFPAHTAAVNDLSFDVDGEYVGSCSDDGSVVINSLFTDEKMKFDYHRPMKAISLDPDYTRKMSRRFVAGGLAGHLYLNSKKWLGYRDQVLHSGEGPIHVVKWRTSLIAWANDAGVKVYDAANDQRITFIERPRGSPRPELLLPHLVWQDDTLLVIGWGTYVKIASIKTNQSNGANGTYRHVGMNQVDIVASFQTSYYISGIAPFGDCLVVLAYIPGEEDGEKEFSSTLPSRQGNAQRPEVRIVTWNNDELTTDALPVLGFEHYKAKDYSLAHAPFSGSSYAGGQWAAGDEPLYYIVSPKDVVIAKPRDAEDHIAWLLEHGRHEKALAAVEAGQGRSELLDEVGSRYLDHLIVERKYAEAASLCPKLLRGSASAWERWVFHFAHLRQLPVLVPYMPTENPRLRDTAYEVALVALATNPSFHKYLLSTVKSWPPVIYSALPVISAIEPQLNSSSMTDALKEALAELYVIDGQYEKAFSLYADLMKPYIFDFIEKHNLHDAIREKVVQLMLLDCKRAVSLLIQNKDLITPSEVVTQLLNARDKCDSRYFLHLYLHALFEVNPHAGKDFHDMQVELYADYDLKMLLPFLRSSQHYTLEKAYEICVKRDLLREQVFILGRMGNTKHALAVIINKLGDIEEAVEFVNMQHDDELWEELIKQCLNKPEMVGVLLEHTVGNLDPLYIVNMVPNGLEIPRLRDRLVKIITDYRTETSLRHGCNDILKADIVNLLVKYYKEARRAVCLTNEEDDARAKRVGSRASQATEKVPSVRTMEVKSKTRGGARCCMCFDPFSIQNVSVIVFFCCHAYHMDCLKDSMQTVNGKKGAGATHREPISEYEYDNGVEYENDDDDDEAQSGAPRMRCILCTTAAS